MCSGTSLAPDTATPTPESHSRRAILDRTRPGPRLARRPVRESLDDHLGPHSAPSSPSARHGTRKTYTSELRFRGNSWSTLGVEVELQLVDSRTMALRSAIAETSATSRPRCRTRSSPSSCNAMWRSIREFAGQWTRWKPTSRRRSGPWSGPPTGTASGYSGRPRTRSRGGETSGSPPTSGIISWPAPAGDGGSPGDLRSARARGR